MLGERLWYHLKKKKFILVPRPTGARTEESHINGNRKHIMGGRHHMLDEEAHKMERVIYSRINP